MTLLFPEAMLPFTDGRRPRVRKRHLTKDDCQEAALRYRFRTEFMRGHRAAYNRSREMGWLADVCAHMGRRIAPNGYWTKERCAEIAKNYKTRTQFLRAHSGCYSMAYQKGFLDEICRHMETPANSSVRWVYAIKSTNQRLAYVGLTWNVKQRLRGHRNRGQESVRSLLAGAHTVEILTGPHEPRFVGQAEQDAIDFLRNEGWVLLNSAKPGALGGKRIKWTKSRCQEVAAKCETRAEFIAAYPVAYTSCCERGWLEEVARHQKLDGNPAGYWTFERCKEVALQCSSTGEFRKRFGVARQIAQRNGWMAKICEHMKVDKRGNGYWTLDRCLAEATRFSRPIDFIRECPGAHDAARKHGWRKAIYSAIRAGAND